MDYKLYLDFVLANMYKTTNEALQYHFRMLDLHKTGRLTVFEVNYFFRPVIERLHEMKYYEAEQVYMHMCMHMCMHMHMSCSIVDEVLTRQSRRR